MSTSFQDLSRLLWLFSKILDVPLQFVIVGLTDFLENMQLTLKQVCFKGLCGIAGSAASKN